jgi:hypothetical protein
MQPYNHVVTVEPPDPRGTERLAEQIRHDDEIVFAVFALPRSAYRHLNSQSREELEERSYILLGDSEKIRMKEFVPPEKTTFGEAWFRFPRPEITSAFQKIKFVTSLEVPHQVSVEVEFDVPKLKFGGRLEY